MVEAVEKTSRLTAKGQTTIPDVVRRALKVGPGDSLTYRIDRHGVFIRRSEVAPEGDPVIDSFLEFLARSIANAPETITPLAPALAARLRALAQEIEVDPDAPIEGEVAL